MNAISTPRPALRRVAALGTAAALALCLALPAMLCRAETTALEGTVLTRPALESTLTAEGQSDPLAQALYQGRTLYDSSSQRLELDRDTICSQLSGSVAELYDAGVLSAPALDLAGELMGVEGEASASRSADGTVQYSYFVYSGHLLEVIWQPDLALPVELMIAHPTLPAADPDQLLQAWRAFLGRSPAAGRPRPPTPTPGCAIPPTGSCCCRCTVPRAPWRCGSTASAPRTGRNCRTSCAPGRRPHHEAAALCRRGIAGGCPGAAAPAAPAGQGNLRQLPPLKARGPPWCPPRTGSTAWTGRPGPAA